ncbi:lytic transglycosylase [Novimethylophilus kurashikiensis]|uniref:Lytic transglycosylase n=1 Tax=Novimethylophilus kurashikiensis TaxID=1825523 RepID=A0A2R5F3A7_9PROT|nr:hypothetical protein [Novimethylophilus kurashikiensis]GBG12997.1 lytic transglycosylase [Novimethylophilus kurashikiensis]
MEARLCVSCGQEFTPRAQSPRQTYCSQPKCQRVRQQHWQRTKLKTDPDYIDNQARARENWLAKNPDYYHQYRARNRQYAERNRAMQRFRNRKIRLPLIANIDAPHSPSLLASGIYQLSFLSHQKIAKKDAWIVEIVAFPKEPKVLAPRKTIANR